MKEFVINIKTKTRNLDKKLNEILSRIINAYMGVLVTIYLLLFGGGYATIAEEKYKAFLIIHISFLTVFALVKVQYNLITTKSEKKIKHQIFANVMQNPSFYFILYLMFTYISAINSDYNTVFFGYERKEGILTITIYVATYFLISNYGRFNKIILWLFSGSVSLFCLLGILQLTGANPFELYPPTYNFYGAYVHYNGEFCSTIGNTNFCSSLLSLALGIIVACMIRKKEIIDNYYAIPLVLCVFLLIKLNVEAGLVAMLIGLVVIIPISITDVNTFKNCMNTYAIILLTVGLSSITVFTSNGAYLRWNNTILVACFLAFVLLIISRMYPCLHSKLSSENLQRKFFIFTLICCFFSLFIIYNIEDLPYDFLSQVHQILHGNIDDKFGSGRIYIWKEVLSLIPKYFWFGSGPDTLAFLNIESFSRYDAELGFEIFAGIDTAHNEYLNIFINQGFLAITSYCMGIIFSLRRWYIYAEDDRIMIAGAGVCFYLIQAFFGISTYITAPYFWVFLAILNQKIKEETFSVEGIRRKKK